MPVAAFRRLRLLSAVTILLSLPPKSKRVARHGACVLQLLTAGSSGLESDVSRVRAMLGWLLVVVACISVVSLFLTGAETALQRQTAQEPPEGAPQVPQRPATVLDLTGVLGLAIVCLIVAARLLARRKSPPSRAPDDQA